MATVEQLRSGQRAFFFVAILLLVVSRESAAHAAQPGSPSATSSTFPPPDSEQHFAANGLGLELGGSGLFLSANYERRLFRVLLVHAGIGYIGICGDVCDAVVTAPLTMAFLLGGAGHHVELGGGTILAAGAGKPGFYPTAVAGYRYQRDQGGIFVRVAFTPIWFEKGGVPWGGVMVGYAF